MSSGKGCLQCHLGHLYGRQPAVCTLLCYTYASQGLVSLTSCLRLWRRMELVPGFKHCTGGSWKQEPCPDKELLVSIFWTVVRAGKRAGVVGECGKFGAVISALFSGQEESPRSGFPNQAGCLKHPGNLSNTDVWPPCPEDLIQEAGP